MLDSFDTLQRPKAYAQIVDQILDRIRVGGFKPGDRLPPERELSSSFGVSRGTLKEAIRVLEHAGVLEVRVGSGTYVSAAGVAEDVRLRAHAAALGDYSPLDVLEARIAIEPLSVAAAVRRASDAELRAIGDHVVAHRQAVESHEDPTEFDLGFHLAIASAGRNEVLLVQTRQLIEWMSQSTWKQYKAGARKRAGDLTFVVEHEAIYAAIAGRDADTAVAAMRGHLETIRQGMLDVMQD